jgi:uncharacterized cupredoxin-like copper-binding protein
MFTSRRTPSLIALAAAASLALAACGSSSSTSSTSTGSTSSSSPASPAGASGYGGATSTPAAATAAPAGAVKLTADPSGALKFDVSTLHAKAGAVTVQMVNPAGSGLPHGVAVEGHGVDKDSKIVQSGGTATLTVTLKPGTYQFYCPVKGHKAAGMKGTLIVT